MTDNYRNITNLHSLLDYDARRFSSAEVQLRNSLPGWISMAASLKLKAVLQKYLDYVNQHVQRLEAFFEAEEISSLSTVNRLMQSFIDETNDKLSRCADAEVKDACLLACVQVINHYKISIYGTSAAFAKALSMENFARLFHEAEVNEKQIDDRLTQLAEHEINIKARTPIVIPG
jgi:ferritin-like metal-binding protein YciE